jgi:hypothetical protein
MPPEIPDPIATIRSVDIRVINIEIVSSKYEMLPTNNIVKTSKLICMCAPELMILGRDIVHVRFNLLKTCMNYLTDASKVVQHFERNWSGVSGPVRASQYRSADIILKSGPLACPLLAQADIGECSASGDVCLTPNS